MANYFFRRSAHTRLKFCAVVNSWHHNQQLVGAVLRSARNFLNVSIRELAKVSGVSTSQILRIESGEFDAKVSTLLRICRHLGVPAGLVLEQGSLPNPGYYVQLIGQTGLGQVAVGLRPADFPRNAHSRLVIFCSRAAASFASLLESSNASRLVQLINFPLASMSAVFTDFAATIDQLGVADRLSLHRELDTEPVELLYRLKLLTRDMAAEVLTKNEANANLQPNFLKYF